MNMPSNDNAERIHRILMLMWISQSCSRKKCQVCWFQMKKQVTSIVLFVIALSCVFVRTVIRLRFKKQLFIGDFFLYFRVICLCAALGLMIKFSKDMFLHEALITNSLTTELSWDFLALRIRYHKVIVTHSVLTYTAIFFVKFSFLFFFCHLITRIRQMNFYWWTVFLTTIVTWIISIVVCIFVCSNFDIRSDIIRDYSVFLLDVQYNVDEYCSKLR